jgi:hypothetical protein
MAYGIVLPPRNVLQDSLAGPVAERVSAEFGVRDAELRVELVASHVVGLAFARCSTSTAT